MAEKFQESQATACSEVGLVANIQGVRSETKDGPSSFNCGLVKKKKPFPFFSTYFYSDICFLLFCCITLLIVSTSIIILCYNNYLHTHILSLDMQIKTLITPIKLCARS